MKRKTSNERVKNILAIIGSASENSSNHKLVHHFENLTKDVFKVNIYDRLRTLPHFDPILSISNTPAEIADFRSLVEKADGIIISTPEYVFSIPSGLKNAIEWSVSTTIFTGKPLGIITASANGMKGHEELQLIMKTVMAEFTAGTLLLVQGVKGKINEEGTVTDTKTRKDLAGFVAAFKDLVNNAGKL